MSFILDALKKSEAERQRQTGPTLLEVRVVQSRRRYPPWILVVGGLLILNLALLLWFALHKPPANAASPPAAAAPPAPAGAAARAVIGVPVSPPASPPATPPAMAPAAMTPPATASAAPSLDTQGGSDSSHNPADDEPAVPPSVGSVKIQRDSSGGYASLPNLSELGGDAPALRLDLHVYSEHIADRYALINMRRVHEGDVLPEGARVLAITREGVAMSYHGQDFMLRPQ